MALYSLSAHVLFAGCDDAYLRLGNYLDAGSAELSFSLFSANAERVEVSLFTQALGGAPVGKILLAKDPRAPGRWRVSLSRAERKTLGLADGQTLYYGYRLWGPNWRYDPAWQPGTDIGFQSDVDENGNRFNPNKLVYDPRALELSHDPVNPHFSDEGVYGTGPINRVRDSGFVAPKGVVLNPPAETRSPIQRALKKEIIYEAHVRGLTMADPDVPEAERGTFRGAARKAKYLKELGITTVEFLPVHAFQNELNSAEGTRGNNYWGYMTNSFFALNRRFATKAAQATPGGTMEEFREMIDAYHREGIKVIMDVVYNHTGEAGASGYDGEVTSILSMRGIDSSTYYQVADNPHKFKDNTGCGANLNCANPHTRQLVLDSLKLYRSLGVDGFRFDLASVLGNVHERGDVFFFDHRPAENVLNQALLALPGRPYDGGDGMDLIAEPWAIGDNSFQVGGFPYGWAEWNGHGFRDPMRISQNKMGVERVTPGEIAHAIAGSRNIFGRSGRLPGHSINFMVAHDGFPNADLYRYNEKQNNQRGHFGPSNGGEDRNLSWNQALPGGTPAQTLARQKEAAAKGLASSLLSFGIPMFTAGDEMLRTQRGNNNMYNVDSPGSWLDWSLAKKEAGFLEYTKRLIAFRHAHPIFSEGRELTGAIQPSGLKDVSWHQADGASAETQTYMDDPAQTFLAYRVDTSGTSDTCRSIYIANNYGGSGREIRLPPPAAGKKWYWAGDTSSHYDSVFRLTKVGEETVLHPAEPTGLGAYLIGPRALALFVEK